MSDILGLIFSGSGGLLAGAGALLALIVGVFFKGKSSERNRQRAKEADSYEQHLKDISDAHDARNRIDPDRLPANDPYRRD